MHNASPVTFNNITSAHFAAMCAEAGKSGLSITSPSGQTSKDGVTVSWDYVEAAQTFTYTIINAPFFVPISTIESKFAAFIASTVPALIAP